ncbi:hypothetical protein H4R33_003033 [Dimargaris cristalligena]|nr:hypothetical protein H4R33_003033 [Dimargaris cristalligena]
MSFILRFQTALNLGQLAPQSVFRSALELTTTPLRALSKNHKFARNTICNKTMLKAKQRRLRAKKTDKPLWPSKTRISKL